MVYFLLLLPIFAKVLSRTKGSNGHGRFLRRPPAVKHSCVGSLDTIDQCSAFRFLRPWTASGRLLPLAGLDGAVSGKLATTPWAVLGAIRWRTHRGSPDIVKISPDFEFSVG